MPIYEYACPDCGHAFEKRVGFSDSDNAQPCPVCGNSEAHRQISLIGRTSTGSSSTGYSAASNCGPVG